MTQYGDFKTPSDQQSTTRHYSFNNDAEKRLISLFNIVALVVLKWFKLIDHLVDFEWRFVVKVLFRLYLPQHKLTFI